MKYIILPLYLLLFIVILSSCSSRYSRVPKVRAKTKAKTTLTQKVKIKKTQSIPQVLSAKKANSTNLETIDLKQKSISIAPLQITAKATLAQKETPQTTIHKSNKKTQYKHNRQQAGKAQKRQAETDFWDTFFGEFLMELLFLLVLCLIMFFLHWLVEIGLGWIVAILLIAIAIWIIIELVNAASDVLDFLSDFLFWGH